MNPTFRSLIAEPKEDAINLRITQHTWDDLPPGDVTIRVAYSSINYKDALACTPNAKVAKTYPLVPGIDLAGHVVASHDNRYREGDPVIVTGYELGVAHAGGYSEYARVPADWIVPLPQGLTLQEAMIIGTAGLTAALSVYHLELNGLTPEQGPVLVTGATGGVGSLAIAILATQQYRITASTGSTEEEQYLKQLGAENMIGRLANLDQQQRALRKEMWAAAIDPVGGQSLSYLLTTMQYGGLIALSGLAGGSALETTVFPFILRGVKLLGIDSVYCPHELRKELWHRMAHAWKPRFNPNLYREVQLEQVSEVLQEILAGNIRGRVIVKL